MFTVNSFAAPATRIDVYSKYYIHRNGYYITSLYGNTNNALYMISGGSNQSDYQKWMPGSLEGDVKLYANFTVGTNTQYIMYYSTYTDSMELTSEYGVSNTTSSIDFHTINSSTGSYRMYLQYLSKYLSASTSYGTTINGRSYSESSSLQKWSVET